MSAKIRSIAGVFAGVVTSGIVVFMIEGASQLIWPPPPEFMEAIENHPEKLSELLDLIPFPAKLAVLLAWALGPVAGGFVTTKLTRSSRPSRFVGIIMLSFVILNLMFLPHPLWMAAAGIILPIPAARIGSRLARPTSPDSTPQQP